MTDNFLSDPAEDKRRMDAVLRHVAQYRAFDRMLTEEDALNAANFARYYVDPSPEMAAVVAQAKIPYDDATLSEIVGRAAAADKDTWWDKVQTPFKAAVRGATTYMEGLWEEGISRPVRTGIRAYQDDEGKTSVADEWRGAGASDAAMAAGELGQGNRVNLGSGYFAQSDLAAGNQQFRDDALQGTKDNVAIQQQAVEAGQLEQVNPVAAAQSAKNAAQEDFYENSGRAITYEGQATRESTIIEGWSGYQTPFSFGRAAAVQAFAPGTVPFNVLSGTIDGGARMILDPVNVPANEVAAAFKARKLLIPARLEDTGAIQSWRPWVRPHKADEYVRGAGDQIMGILAESKDFNEVTTLIGDMPVNVRLAVLDADNKADVIKALKGELGVTQKNVPQLTPELRSRYDASNGIVSKWKDQGLSKWGDALRRQTAETGMHILNPYDTDGSIRATNAWLDTIKAPAATKAAVAETIARNPGAGVKQAKGMLREALNDELKIIYKVEEGGDEAVSMVNGIMDDFEALQAKNSEYLHDLAGRNILEGKKTMEMTGPGGKKFTVKVQSAHLDSEIADQMTILPRVRSVREATSKMRVTRNKIRAHFGMKEPITGTDSVMMAGDTLSAIWRNMALLRPAWTLRVIPEELIRQGGAGYSDILMHPGSYFSLMGADNAKFATMLDDATDAVDVFNAEDLGAGAFLRDKHNQSITGTRFDASRTSWEVVPTVGTDGVTTAQGRMGLSREIMQLWGSDLATNVASSGIDDAIKYYRTAAGKEALIEIARKALPDSDLALIAKRTKSGKWVVDEQLLRNKLESVEARIAMMTGGDIVYFDDVDGIWRHATGAEVDDPMFWSKKQQVEALRADPPYAGRSKLKDSKQRGAALREQRGLPDFEELREGQKYVITKDGKPELRDLIAKGTDVDGNVKLQPGMSRGEIIDFEHWIPEQFDDDFVIPAHVKAPNAQFVADSAKKGRAMVDEIYKAFMQMPTKTVVRGPFAKLRYTDEVGRFYLFGDDAARRKINAWAKKNNMENELLNSIRTNANEYGIKHNGMTSSLDKLYDSMPSVKGKKGFTWREIDDISRGRALEQSKELFYDLANKGNWADSMRLISPFADAWAEVLTRWADMLGPGLVLPHAAGKRGAGAVRAVRNWERAGQAVDALRSNGIFHENEFGEEVISFPGTGSFIPGLSELGGITKTEVSLSQLTFLDPSVRGFGGPGIGPGLQLPASYAQPMLAKIPLLRDAANYAVYGEYAPYNVDEEGAVLTKPFPTWMRRTYELFTDEANKKVIGDEVAQVYMALLQSGDPRWGDDTPEKETRTWERAREIGNQYALTRVFDAAVLPANPRYLPQFMKDLPDTGMANEWMTVAAVNDEYQGALTVFEDKQMALNYVMDKYGFDALGLTPKTQRLKYRPMDSDGWDELNANPQFRDLDITLMAFLPPAAADAAFSQVAWSDAITSGAYEYMTPEVSRRMINQQKGSREWQQVQEDYDNALEQAEARFGKDSHSFRDYRDNDLIPWKNGRKNEIGNSHFGWDEANPYEPVYGSERKPTKEETLSEVRQVTIPGTKEYKAARSTEMGAIVANFMTNVMDVWDDMDEYSISQGRTANWWRSSEPSVDQELLGEMEYGRRYFNDGVQYYIDQIDDRDAKMNAEWLLEKVFNPLVKDQSLDQDAVFYVPTEPPAPGGGSKDDRMPNDEGVMPNG